MRRRSPVESSIVSEKDDTANPSDGRDEDTSPLDEDEQETVIQDFQAETKRQQEEFYVLFRILCYLAAVLSILLVAAEEWLNRPPGTIRIIGRSRSLHYRFLHGSLSAALQWVTMRYVHPRYSTVVQLNFVLLVVVNIICVLMIADDALGIGMGVANAVTVGVGLLMKWDQRDSQQAIHELFEAKYRYKKL